MVTISQKCGIIIIEDIIQRGGIFLEFKANNDNMFSIPCVVVDNLLQMASGDHIKVLLYILRRSGRDFAENEISDETGVSQEEVDKAIDFWRRAKVLTSSSTDNNNIPPVKQITEDTAVPENPPEQKKKRYKQGHLSGADIAEIKTSDTEMSELFDLVEDKLGLLNSTQANLIIYMHNDLGLKKEVIITLIEYCKDMGKTNTKYIEKIAYSWYENNINTLEFAQEEVERLMANNDYTAQVKRITVVERISKDDEAIIEQWSEWNISLDLVEKAYDITTGQIHKLSFQYMNKIISSWYEKGIKDLEEANKEDKTHKKKNTRKRKVHNDDDFDVDMYKIFINDYEVI